MKINEKIKILTGVLGVTILLSFSLFFLVCSPDSTQQEQAKDQTATIDLFEDNTATVKGHFTDTEWNGVAGKIETAINTAFINETNPNKNRFRDVFRDDVIIIVEKTNVYNFYQVKDGEFRTLYLNINKLDNTELQSKITGAVRAMVDETPDIAKYFPAHRKNFNLLIVIFMCMV